MRLTIRKLMKTNIEKMSVFCLSTMLMKRNELKRSLHDVDEKKGRFRIPNSEPLTPYPVSRAPYPVNSVSPQEVNRHSGPDADHRRSHPAGVEFLRIVGAAISSGHGANDHQN